MNDERTEVESLMQQLAEERSAYQLAHGMFFTEKLRLTNALAAAVATIQDYLAYTHDGDPWTEDARTMGEMDINAYGQDGRLSLALFVLAHNTPEKD